MEVADGVLQFKVPRPPNPNVPDGGLLYTLVYIIDTPQGRVQIDAGDNTDEGFQKYQRDLSEAGIEPSEVKLIVITHGHSDHAGLANRVKALTGARVAMHRLDANGGEFRRRVGILMESPETARMWAHRSGIPDSEIDDEFLNRGRRGPRGNNHEASQWRDSIPQVDWLLEGGEELVEGSGLWTIWTPGHSAGHLCIHDQYRHLLFSGDHILPVITPHVTLFPGDEGNPLASFLDAQRYLRDLDVQRVHPAHEYSFPDLRQRVNQILEHHEERLQEMLGQVQDGPKSAYQIAAGISWNVAPWEKLNTNTRRAALMETMSHLKHLLMEGRLVKQENNSIDQYLLP